MAILARVPELQGARARRLRAPLGAAAAVGVAALALRLRDPHQHGSWGLCPFKALTGWDCPLCGGLRSVNDLGRGQLLDAAHSNLLFVGSLPLILGLWAFWAYRGWTASSRTLPANLVRPLLVGYCVLAIAFAIYRNTPWGTAWHVA
ncbi:hypothetical protein ACVW00_002428 [Marmoricola sp. URHA0025 HA25]